MGVQLYGMPVSARMIDSSSTALADVKAAVASARSGDTVVIPRGVAVWDGVLSINKSITVRGAGARETVVRRRGVMVSCALRVDAPLRVTGIAFENEAQQNPTVTVVGKKNDRGNTAALTKLRIDHCRFVQGKRAIALTGWVEGIIDHNSFLNCNIAVGIAGDDDASWSRAIEPGGIHTLCLEDNAFEIDNDSPREPNQQVYLQQGARATVRHNTFDSSRYSNGNGIFLDSHGNWPAKNKGVAREYRGQPIVEIYDNTFHAHHTYDFSDYRGGTVFVYNNRFIYDHGSKPSVFKLKEEEAWQTGLFPQKATHWPAKDQISNSHFWNNTLNGELITQIDLHSAADQVFIREGRDFWQSPPTKDTGLPEGKYYPYVPLTYPHPRLSEDENQN